MRWYKLGNGEGRIVGRTKSFEVYESRISPVKGETKISHHMNTVQPEIQFNYGPSTGGLIESVNFSFQTPGELITDVVVNPSYKRRTLNVTGRKPEDALLLMERVNGFHCASNSISFIMAVEDALDIEIPETVSMARIIQLEVERIRSHLTVMERLCSAAGFGVPHNRLAALRESVSRIIGKAYGHRYMFGTGMVGGINGTLTGISGMLEPIVEEFRDLNESLLQSKIFINRLQGNGVIKEDWLVGPAARAAGLRYDARVDSGCLPYSVLNFQPILRHEGDVFGRFMIRAEEIFSSMGIIERAEDELAGKPVSDQASPQRNSGKGAARLESPQGDIFVYVDVEDSEVRNLEILSPGTSNIEAFRKSSTGTIFTDFPFNWESYGIWISEVEVDFK